MSGLLSAKEELDKCELVCSNCHQEEHSDIDKFNKLYEIIIKKIETYNELFKIDYSGVYELYLNGMSQKEISKKLNIPKSSISEYVKKLKLKL